MPRSPTALVNAAMLCWARESSGYSIEQAAKKISTKQDRLQSWENGELRPTINQAKRLANVYKQPFACFFLDQVPEAPNIPQQDLRSLYGTLPRLDSPPLVIETRFALERREIFIELLRGDNEVVPTFQLSATIKDGVKSLATRIRTALGLNNQTQPNWPSERDAFNDWRNRVEKLGVLVFQTKNVEVEEMRGSSLFFEKAPVILLNRKEKPLGRIFSLIHELTHLALRTSGVCDANSPESLDPESQLVEKFCDAVAAETIAPESIFKAVVLSLQINVSSGVQLEHLSEISSRLRVSRQVVTRRLHELKIISRDRYNSLEKSLNRLLRSLPEKKSTGGPSPHVDRISLIGAPLIRRIMEAYHQERISRNDASDYLGLRAKHFGNLEKSLSGS